MLYRKNLFSRTIKQYNRHDDEVELRYGDDNRHTIRSKLGHIYVLAFFHFVREAEAVWAI